MRKVCRFYYGTVINEDGDTWAKKGEHEIEPVGVWGQEQKLGKPPEYCCEGIKYAFDNHMLTVYASPLKVTLMRWSGASGWADDHGVKFCPFCGAKIEFRENLKLRVVKEMIPRAAYHFEETVKRR